MEQNKKDEILASTHIPKEMWSECIVTDDGQVFTPNDVTNETAQQVYEKHLLNMSKKPEPTKEEKINTLQEELLQSQQIIADLEVELLLSK